MKFLVEIIPAPEFCTLYKEEGLPECRAIYKVTPVRFDVQVEHPNLAEKLVITKKALDRIRKAFAVSLYDEHTATIYSLNEGEEPAEIAEFDFTVSDSGEINYI